MSISFFGHTAFEWVGKKIAQCVTGKRDGEEKGAGQRGEGGSKRACRRDRQRQREEQAYREVETYDYEQYG